MALVPDYTSSASVVRLCTDAELKQLYPYLMRSWAS
jgi:hypothetical protein